ncbi:antigen identified by monoclonal antibody Ki-67 [Podila epigama]|nr:antigen identified by monoclonal antibody Ki-67 [Podila epigama]
MSSQESTPVKSPGRRLLRKSALLTSPFGKPLKTNHYGIKSTPASPLPKNSILDAVFGSPDANATLTASLHRTPTKANTPIASESLTPKGASDIAFALDQFNTTTENIDTMPENLTQDAQDNEKSTANMSKETTTEKNTTSRNTGVWGQIVGLKRADGSEYYWYPIYKTVCSFGKNLANDIRVQVETVSDHHCVIIHGGEGEILLKDSSTNGTLRNGELVHNTTVTLNHNDVLTVGGHRFRFESTETNPAQESDETLESDDVLQASVQKAVQSLIEIASPTSTRSAPTTPRKCFVSSTTSLESSLNLFTPNRASRLSKLLMSPKVSTPLFAHIPPKSTPVSKELPCADFDLEIPNGLRSPSVKRRVTDDDNDDVARTPKKVSFGPKLSPEIFDRAQPPSSPIRRGQQQDPDTPRRNGMMSPKMLGGGGPRSAVKSILTPSKLGRTVMYMNLERPAPLKLFSEELLAEAKAKANSEKTSMLPPATGLDDLETKTSDEQMSALLVSPVPKPGIVDELADP